MGLPYAALAAQLGDGCTAPALAASLVTHVRLLRPRAGVAVALAGYSAGALVAAEMATMRANSHAAEMGLHDELSAVKTAAEALLADSLAADKDPVLVRALRGAFSPTAPFWKETDYHRRGYYSFWYDVSCPPSNVVEVLCRHH